MSKIPDLGFWKLWNISFGFFGVQIAYALQSANISRILGNSDQSTNNHTDQQRAKGNDQGVTKAFHHPHIAVIFQKGLL